MKNIKLMKILVFAASLLSLSASFAQQPKPYFAAQGSELTYTDYDNKGKMIGTVFHKVETVYNSADTLFAKIATRDDDGRQKTELKYFLKGVTYEFSDMKSEFFGNEMLDEKELKEKGVEISDMIIVIDPSTKKGGKLPDATIILEVKEGKQKGKAEMGLINRRMEGFETVVTPAGEFRDCIKISGEIGMKYGLIKMPLGKVLTWYAPGVGMVKEEEFDGKKLLSRTELTSLKM